MAALTTLAQYHMDYGDHMDGGWHWGMMALMFIAVVVVVGLVVWFVRSTGGSHPREPRAVGEVAVPETPMQILDRRLAQGEVTPDEYRERASILTGR